MSKNDVPWDGSVPTSSSSDPNDVKKGIEYKDVVQHPRAKEIRDKYDTKHIYSELSVEEKIFFDGNYENQAFAAFFGDNPVKNCCYYNYLQNNIHAYTIYNLMQKREIKLFSFDSSAALSALKVSPKNEVFVPMMGAFVIEYKNITLILEIAHLSYTVEWNWYAKSAKEFSVFDKFFTKSVKRYNQYKDQVFDNDGNFISLPNVSFKDIVLPEGIKKEVKQNIIDYIDPVKLEIKRKNGLPTKRGIIMVGEPGTGKTFLSRVLAKTLKTTFMVVTMVRGENDLQDIFEFAELFDRIIILFEDIDIYSGDRHQGDIVSCLLNKLDGLEVNNHLVVLCTTNNLDALDDALKDRPGRFDRTLHFDPPNKELKIEMLKGYLVDKNFENVDFEKVVKDIPAEYTGAHLKELYITAATEAIESGSVDSKKIAVFTTEIFLDALKKLRGSRKEKTRIGFDKEDS
jgi:AAA+ superfamily predicted ATPase